MIYRFSDATALKLRDKHGVNRQEVIECFQNMEKPALKDTRERHETHPPTQWFIAKTDAGRKLKVVFIQLSWAECVIRTAYPPNEIEEKMYEQKT